MSTITRSTTTPRAADVWGLAFAAARQQKVRTALTMIGVVVGTFTLVVSLAVGQGVDRAIVALFHEDDRLRKVSVHPNYQPSAAEIPESEREPRGSMSEAKRARLRRVLVRAWSARSFRNHRVRLDAAGVRRIEALDHVVRLEPVINFVGKARLEGKDCDIGASSVLRGSRFFADRLLAGRLFTPQDGRAAIVHEYVLYRWGLVGDEDAGAAIGRTFRLEYTSRPMGTVNLGWILDIGQIRADRKPALEAGLKRLAGLVRFLPIPRDEREALLTLFDRLSTTSTTRPEQTFTEDFTIVGVVGERDEKDDQMSRASIGEWNLRDIDILIPVAAASAFYLRGPNEAEDGFNEVVVTVDEEEHVKAVAKRIAAMGFIEYSLAGIIDTVRMNVRLITFAMSSVAVVALVVAAIGITNTMIMSVLERTHEIGIMKALGARDRDVRRIFLVEGTVFGVFGSVLGLALGWLASYPGNAIAKSIMEPQVNTSVKESLLVYPIWLVLGVPAVVCLITTLAALYPASRAARVDPVTSLRHE
jgi:putative ABC transport system permease protein